MGQVYEVEHVALGRAFALKLLRIDVSNDELNRRFRREAKALGAVQSPRVAQVTDFGIDAQVGPFYVMELLDGETLEARLERAGALRVEEALPIAIELAEALAEVHASGLVHRDLKPSNVGLTRHGPLRVKLLDFGLARSVDDRFLERITRSNQVLGSLPYMAPEQFHGADVTPAIDLYALGIVIFEMLAGRPPFSAGTPAALIHQHLAAPMPPLLLATPSRALPASLEAVVVRLLAKEPAGRHASAYDAATALRSVLAELSGERSSTPATRAMPELVGPRTLPGREALTDRDFPAVHSPAPLAPLPRTSASPEPFSPQPLPRTSASPEPFSSQPLPRTSASPSQAPPSGPVLASASYGPTPAPVVVSTSYAARETPERSGGRGALVAAVAGMLVLAAVVTGVTVAVVVRTSTSPNRQASVSRGPAITKVAPVAVGVVPPAPTPSQAADAGTVADAPRRLRRPAPQARPGAAPIAPSEPPATDPDDAPTDMGTGGAWTGSGAAGWEEEP